MARCKNPDCKEKFTPKYFNQKFCMEKDECISAHVEWSKEQHEKNWSKRKAKMRVNTHASENKADLQSQINLLARKIDMKFFGRCIDCGRKFRPGKQVHGSHFHNVGGNEHIRYNLHNIHASASDCNMHHGGRKAEYKEALVERYSEEYMNYVDKEMSLEFDYVGLTNQEIADKLKIVRKLNRDFDTFQLMDGIQARDLFNDIIGIYKRKR